MNVFYKSIVIWSAILVYGASKLKLMRGLQNSFVYCDAMSTTLLLFAAKVSEEKAARVFRKYNASTHISNASYSLSSCSISTLSRPASFLNINIMEHV